MLDGCCNTGWQVSAIICRGTLYGVYRNACSRILDGMSHPALISKFSFLYEARSLGRIVIAREDACATRHRRSVLFHRETAVHVFRAGCSRHERSLPTIVTPTYQWVGSNRISNAIKSDSSNTTAPMTENRLNWPHENIFNVMHKDSTIEENDRDPNVTHRNGTQNSPWAVDLITPDPT